MTSRTRAKAPAGPFRQILHSDPIALIGVAISIGLSITLDVTGAASGVESLLAGLMGTTISLVLDASARAERRFELRRLVRAPSWLAGSMVSLADSAAEIAERHPGSEVEDEARERLEWLREQFAALSEGRIERPRADLTFLLQATAACAVELNAVTNVVGLPTWWDGRGGKAYWQANLDALARGVRISRVFIRDGPTAELDDLIAVQRAAGVRVTVVERRDLDPSLHHNLVVWDGRRAWEARMSAQGEIAANLFLVGAADVRRLDGAFRRCLSAARPPER